MAAFFVHPAYDFAYSAFKYQIEAMSDVDDGIFSHCTPTCMMILQKQLADRQMKGSKILRKDIIIRPETHKDYKEIISLILHSFSKGTDYSDGTDIIALVEEIRDSEFYIPELSFVAELDRKIVGHFLFSRFPLSKTKSGGHIKNGDIVMLAPVAVHADYFHQHVGFTMLTLGIRKVREYGVKGITVEGDYHFYNRIGFKTSSEFDIYPTSGIPLEEPKCMMCQETSKGSLNDVSGYVVYDMYYNA